MVVLIVQNIQDHFDSFFATFECVFDVFHFWDLLDGVFYLGAEISLSIGVYAIEWVLLIW